MIKKTFGNEKAISLQKECINILNRKKNPKALLMANDILNELIFRQQLQPANGPNIIK